MQPQRRGPYKKYLHDVNEPVPSTTAWLRRRQQGEFQDAAVNRNIAICNDEFETSSESEGGSEDNIGDDVEGIQTESEMSTNSNQAEEVNGNDVDQEECNFLQNPSDFDSDTERGFNNVGTFEVRFQEAAVNEEIGNNNFMPHRSSSSEPESDNNLGADGGTSEIESGSEVSINSNQDEEGVGCEIGVEEHSVHNTSDSNSDNESSFNNAEGFGARDGDHESAASDSESSRSSSSSEISAYSWNSTSGDNSSVSDYEEEVNHPEVPIGNNGILEGRDLQFHDNEAGRGNPLYRGCRLTAEESAILIMSFIIRWGLEENSIEHLLELIDCHLPASVLGSRYMFLKGFPVPQNMKIRLFCPECNNLLVEQGEAEIECDCGQNVNCKELQRQGNFFVQLSISEQLKNILGDEKLHGLMRKNCEEKDVIEGKRYRHLRARGTIGIDDVSVQWNTDGLKPYKSAKSTVWPIQMCINELPYRARKENMILCGLYYGKKKPDLNVYLTPFVEELQALHNVGFECNIPGRVEPVNVKVHAILASVDSVARPPLQGIMQYNGRFGCSFCLKEGEQIERGRGRARVYPGTAGEPRTKNQHLRDLQALEDYNHTNRPQKKHIHGVKFPSVLLLVPKFCIISSFVPDYLHSVLEGVVLTFIKHWTDFTYKEEDWYLSKRKIKVLSERLIAILPPVEVTRPPRSFDDIELLKASELKNFLIYYSVPCLKELLPDKYLKHWYLFAYSITIFLRDKFSHDDFLKAKRAILKFVKEIANIYPDCQHLYTFNVHLMLHIPEAVENYGALWASSTFPYEHFNGVLARLITGTRSVPQQICRSYLRLKKVNLMGQRIFSHPECSEQSKKFYEKMMSKYRSSKHSRLFEGGLRLFGAPQNYEISLLEGVLVRRLLGIENIHTTAQSYRRFISQGIVYHASCYETLKVRNNSTVRMENNTFLSIKRILLVHVLGSDEKYCVVLGEEFDILHDEICNDRELNLSSTDLFPVCDETGRTICVFPQNISKKCVSVPYKETVCISSLVNSLETD